MNTFIAKHSISFIAAEIGDMYLKCLALTLPLINLYCAANNLSSLYVGALVSVSVTLDKSQTNMPQTLSVEEMIVIKRVSKRSGLKHNY